MCFFLSCILSTKFCHPPPFRPPLPAVKYRSRVLLHPRWNSLDRGCESLTLRFSTLLSLVFHLPSLPRAISAHFLSPTSFFWAMSTILLPLLWFRACPHSLLSSPLHGSRPLTLSFFSPFSLFFRFPPGFPFLSVAVFFGGFGRHAFPFYSFLPFPTPAIPHIYFVGPPQRFLIAWFFSVVESFCPPLIWLPCPVFRMFPSRFLVASSPFCAPVRL